MTYRIEISNRAVRDLELLFLEKNAAESQAASRWFNGLEEAVHSLSSHPHRCPVAPESDKIGRQLRHYLHGNKPHVYRIIYEIDESHQTIWVLHIRHGARRPSGEPDLQV